MPQRRHSLRLGWAVWHWLSAGAAGGLLLGALAGCATAHDPAVTANAAGLREKLCGLSPEVEPAEARRAADTACGYAAYLAREWRVVWPPLLHNCLVNLHLRPRGLCYQWADDISAKLAELHLRTLQIHRGVAHLDTRREHSSVVLTAPGQPFERGIVLDAWRHGGWLYWGAVATDKYPWIEVEVRPAATLAAPGTR